MKRENAESMIANYLRFKPEQQEMASTGSYLKATAYATKAVEIERPMIGDYLPQEDEVGVIFKKVGGGSINISCGGKKSIDFRVKCAERPPSALKIDGKNNSFVAIEDQDTEGFTVAPTRAAAEESSPSPPPRSTRKASSSKKRRSPSKAAAEESPPSPPPPSPPPPSPPPPSAFGRDPTTGLSLRTRKPPTTLWGGGKEDDITTNNLKVELFAMIHEAIDYSFIGDDDNEILIDVGELDENQHVYTAAEIRTALREYQKMLQMVDQIKARDMRALSREALSREDIMPEVIDEYRQQFDTISS